MKSERKPRLLIVSNRLPITVQVQNDGSFLCSRSTGGLVAGLSGLSEKTPFAWYGWPGVSVPREEDQDRMRKHLQQTYDAVPLFLPEHVAKDFYSGFCNGILWPLFHYHPHHELSFNTAHFTAYTSANLIFAETLAHDIQPGDTVWIHDFHLMCVPAMLTRLLDPAVRGKIRIGFFLHTPFPSSEVYRILPVRKELLRGLLGGADCIGFQTYDYARHFMSSCSRILGLHCFPDGVEFEGRKVKVGTYPIGIDPDKFVKGLESPSVQAHIAKLRSRFRNTKIMIGIDRLDYIKALPQKLHAFSHLLHTHPELRDGRCVLIQVAVPSRGDVLEYQNLERVVNGLVGKVNGRFGCVEHVPVHYVHKGVAFEELVALYAVADVCVVASTRDGMNLVSYEFIASQQGQHGALVLSEFAGAAQSMNGAIIVNPWNTEELSNGMYEALTMSAKQKEENYKKLSRYVNKYTAERWGTSFVNDLRSLPDSFTGNLLLPLTPEIVAKKYQLSKKKRVFFIDYDGTLIATGRLPEFSNPSKPTRGLIRKLASLPDTYVYIMSGRSRAYLDTWFGDLSVGLCAEHGCFYRHPPTFDATLIEALMLESDRSINSTSPISSPIHGSFLTMSFSNPSVADMIAPRPLKNQTSITASSLLQSAVPYSPMTRHISPFRMPPQQPASPNPSLGAASSSGGGGGSKPVLRRMQHGWFALVDQVDSSWCDEIRPLFEYYTERTPGSLMEEKEVNMTWNYRNSDPEFGMWQAAELHVNLEQIVNHLALSIILGNRTVEVRPSMVDKATAARSIVHDLNLATSPVSLGAVDFYACFGDGKTDEVVFQYLKEFGDSAQVATCTIGRKQSEAVYFLENVNSVVSLLDEFLLLVHEGNSDGSGNTLDEVE